MFFHGRLPNWCDADYDKIMGEIIKMTEQKHALFTRIYQLSPMSFDKVLSIIDIEPQLLSIKRTVKYFLPPIIKLCLRCVCLH